MTVLERAKAEAAQLIILVRTKLTTREDPDAAIILSLVGHTLAGVADDRLKPMGLDKLKQYLRQTIERDSPLHASTTKSTVLSRSARSDRKNGRGR